MMQHIRQKISLTEIAGLFLLGCAILARVAWYLSTHYVVDDAYITFRFADQLASGNGFVFNNGEPIYGTTTPFFALLLAGWHLLTHADVPTGATLANLTASLATLLFTWRALRNLGTSPIQQLYVIGMLAFCYRAVVAETKGMETAWVVCFMAASWWAATSGRAALAGLFCGLLLWTRPDTFLWIFALTLVTSRTGLHQAGQILLVCTLTYLPWFLFASWYFGSPIPHTITAKWVAYVQFNPSPFSEQALLVLNSLSPFSLFPVLNINLMSWLTVLLCGWHGLRNIKLTWFNILPIFIVLEALRLAITKATFFPHYVYPALWATLLMLGLSLGALHQVIFQKSRWLAVAFCLVPLFMFSINATIYTENIRVATQVQTTKHAGALTAIGQWLKQHAAPNASVLLEPLGYIGYYAERRMIDEAGLISPAIVELKRSGNNDVYAYLLASHPDYVILHCDESILWLDRSKSGEITFASDFFEAITFDSLGLKIDAAQQSNQLAHDACYEIWQRRP